MGSDGFKGFGLGWAGWGLGILVYLVAERHSFRDSGDFCTTRLLASTVLFLVTVMSYSHSALDITFSFFRGSL